jgi:hypothetical protein
MTEIRVFKMGVPLLLLALSAGCGSDDVAAPTQDEPGNPLSMSADGPADVNTSDHDEVVSAADIATCAGFTIEDAAAILQVAVSDLDDRSESYSEALHLCSYRLQGSSQGTGFYLSVSPSVERAIAEKDQGREMAGISQQTIDLVTGHESQEKALEELRKIGEDAYFMEVNGTLNVRVGNVQIQVFHLDEREQMLAVARKVAGGLGNR